MPGVGALNDPSSWFPIDTPNESILTAAPNMGSYASISEFNLDSRVVVALVKTEVFRASRADTGLQGDGVQCLADHATVVDVGSCDRDRDRHAAAIGQYMPFRTQFPPVGRVWAGQSPPFGAFTMAPSKELQSNSTPSS